MSIRNSVYLGATLIVMIHIGCNRDGKVSEQKAKSLMVSYIHSQYKMPTNKMHFRIKEFNLNNIWEKMHAQLFEIIGSGDNGMDINQYFVVYKRNIVPLCNAPMGSVVVGNDGIYFTRPVLNYSQLVMIYFEGNTPMIANGCVFYNYDVFVKAYVWGIGLEIGDQMSLNKWSGGEFVGKVSRVGSSLHLEKVDTFRVHLDPHCGNNSSECWTPDWWLTPENPK